MVLLLFLLVVSAEEGGNEGVVNREPRAEESAEINKAKSEKLFSFQTDQIMDLIDGDNDDEVPDITKAPEINENISIGSVLSGIRIDETKDGSPNNGNGNSLKQESSSQYVISNMTDLDSSVQQKDTFKGEIVSEEELDPEEEMINRIDENTDQREIDINAPNIEEPGITESSDLQQENEIPDDFPAFNMPAEPDNDKTPDDEDIKQKTAKNTHPDYDDDNDDNEEKHIHQEQELPKFETVSKPAKFHIVNISKNEVSGKGGDQIIAFLSINVSNLVFGKYNQTVVTGIRGETWFSAVFPVPRIPPGVHNFSVSLDKKKWTEEMLILVIDEEAKIPKVLLALILLTIMAFVILSARSLWIKGKRRRRLNKLKNRKVSPLVMNTIPQEDETKQLQRRHGINLL